MKFSIRIDKDTDDALQNVEKGRKILTQTYRDVSSNRGLIIRVRILIIFLGGVKKFSIGFDNFVYICDNLYCIFALILLILKIFSPI